MELIEHLEGGLIVVVASGQFVLEVISVFCVLLGLLKALQFISHSRRHSRSREGFPINPYNQLRLRFGAWLALALEFQLGADILATTINTSLESLVRLAIIAVIRTFLNYFLGKEMESELEFEVKRQGKS